jgi:hypothetical protein
MVRQGCALEQPIIDHGVASISLLAGCPSGQIAAPYHFISAQTIDKIGDAAGVSLDKRRFRANMYADLLSADGFAEDEFVGRKLLMMSHCVIDLDKSEVGTKVEVVWGSPGKREELICATVARSAYKKDNRYRDLKTAQAEVQPV